MKHVKDLVDEQERELERAVIGRGKYRFRKEYKYLQCDEQVWFRMSREQREKHLKRVAKITVSVHDEITNSPRQPADLSVDPAKFQNGLNIPLPSIQGIWMKAATLVFQPNSIVSAPGEGTVSKMVASKSGKRPHLVTCGKNGRYSCDSDCPNWKSLKICSHTVAVAHMDDRLQDFCDYFRKSKHLPSMTQLLLSGMPSGIGKKGNRVQRKRKKEEITTFVASTPQATTKKICQSAHIQQPSTSEPQITEGDLNIQDTGMESTTQPTSTAHGQSGNSGSSFGGSTPLQAMHPTPVSPWVHWQSQYAQSAQYPQPGINFQTNSGNIRVQSSPMHVSTPYTWPTNSPSYEFRLCFRTGNISTCNGCRNKFNKSIQPPLDLCVQHEEWRNFISPVSHLPDSRFGNAYYHASPLCIMSRWPAFTPSSLVIPPAVYNQLLPSHKTHVQSLFGVTVTL